MKSIDIGLINLFDQHLHQKGISYSASIVGGTAIMLIAGNQRTTGDIDSLQAIPDSVRTEIFSFAVARGLEPTWFNDHASHNFSEFVRKGEDVFATLVFDGTALRLFTPSIKTLLLSKIYPMLDRPEEKKDFQDIEALVAARVVGRRELEEAIKAFEDNIRFEEEKGLRRASRNLVASMMTYVADTFSK